MALDDLCLDRDVSQELRKCVSAGGFKDEETLVQWLTSAPSLTTLRITKRNTRESSADVKASLEDFIQKQYKERGLSHVIPQISFWDDNNHDILKVKALDLKDSFSDVAVNGSVIVDKYCGSAVLRGADIYVKGILGMSFNIKEEDIVNVLVDVDGKCLKGTNASILPSSYNLVKIGIGKSLYSREVIFKSFPQGVGVLMLDTLHPSLDLPQEMESSLFPQNYPSIFTVLALRLTEKEHISMLDMCSSPGGKTLHASEILHATGGNILAVDKSFQKIETVKKNLEKYGVLNVYTHVGDGRTLCDSLDQTFDRILVDAPCSALGKRTCFRIQMKLKELSSYPKVQKHLLDSAVRLLRPGGLLVYSTCTITLGENEDNCSWLLNKYKGILKLDTTNPMLDEVGYKRFSSFDHIGFFVVAFRKKET